MKDIYDKIRLNQEENKVLDGCDKLSNFLSRYKAELYHMLMFDDNAQEIVENKDSYETCVFMIDSIENSLNEHKKDILIMLEDIREVINNHFKYKNNSNEKNNSKEKNNNKEVNYFKE